MAFATRPSRNTGAAVPPSAKEPMHPTLPLLAATDFPALRRRALDTLQVNLGYKCNQSCLHCHVNAGPNRTEMMDADTAALVLQVLLDGTSLSDSFQRIPGIGEGAMARSQEILDELIRRLGERTRPTVERDYLERLLRRF
jgi:hypothetical protein